MFVALPFYFFPFPQRKMNRHSLTSEHTMRNSDPDRHTTSAAMTWIHRISSAQAPWALVLMASASLALGQPANSGALPIAPAAGPAKTQQALEVDRYFHGYVLEPRESGALETTLCLGGPGQHWCVYNESKKDLTIKRKASNDAGRTWTSPETLLDSRGQPIQGRHITMLRLKSGRWGLVYATLDVPAGRPGRDGGTVFRSSDDGRTWSEPVTVERRFGICCSGHAIVLSNGRVVVPVFKWISHDPTGAAESSNASSLSYSYAYVSNDEGKTWTQSLSELFVSNYRAAYDLEEPAIVELKDGRLLMHLRSQLGRMYRSISQDQGVSWSRPEGLPIAAGYTPCILRRIPKTGDLLMIWNQVSRMEILNGFHRHRLSCAISRDDGQTWTSFKNLESLDTEQVIKPPPAERIEVLEMWDDYGYYQPINRKRYLRAPGVLRICYPNVVFTDNEAVVVYDYGNGTLGEGVQGTKLRTVPIAWFYE